MVHTKMDLICPSKHKIFLNPNSTSCCDPLPGTIRLSEPAEISSLHVSLIRTALLDIDQQPPSNHNQRQRRPKTRFHLHKSKQRSRSLDLQKSSFVSEIFRCNLSTSSTSNQGGAFEFTLSIPCDIPETIERPPLTLSYELAALATTADSQRLTARHVLHVSRLKIPSLHDVSTYIRTFPETNLRAQFILCPQLSPSHEQGCDRHVSAQLLLRDIATPGPRHAELSMVLVKEVTWRVDEIEEWNIQETRTGPIRIHERTIATGCRKGRWTAMIPRAGNIIAAEVKIVIPFDITIDRSADALNDIGVVGLEYSRSAPFLAVKHRLMVTIVTGRETVNRETGSLVDKRDSARIFGATVPIPVHEYAENRLLLTTLTF